MEFFRNNGFDMEGDPLETKINEKAPIEELFLIPTFLDQLTYQHERLIEYIKQKHNIHKMVWFLRVLAHPDQYSENRCFHYPFFSYMVFSGCTDDISIEFIDDDSELDALFGIATQYNNDLYDTAFGYFQGIIQKLISQNNSHNKELIQKIRQKPSQYVYPFVAIMNKSSSEYLYDIVGYQEEGFCGFKEELFRHILECFLDYSGQYSQFTTIMDEITFWKTSFKRRGIEGGSKESLCSKKQTSTKRASTTDKFSTGACRRWATQPRIWSTRLSQAPSSPNRISLLLSNRTRINWSRKRLFSLCNKLLRKLLAR